VGPPPAPPPPPPFLRLSTDWSIPTGVAGPVEASQARAEDLRTQVISYSGPARAGGLANDPVPPQVRAGGRAVVALVRGR